MNDLFYRIGRGFVIVTGITVFSQTRLYRDLTKPFKNDNNKDNKDNNEDKDKNLSFDINTAYIVPNKNINNSEMFDDDDADYSSRFHPSSQYPFEPF